ncbi:MAG: HAD family hydrolase [Clostridia bacterium]|nr:HAD family hydrolase [Clostridia bacterium]
MITTVLFDMGGTLEDIWVDEASHMAAVEALDRMLKSWGLDTGLSAEELREAVARGWKRYDAVRGVYDVELKPVQIWCDYILTDFSFSREALAPHCEEIAHMWEITYFHRRLRPRVADMLEELKGMGLKLGVISNTAALYQVFDSLEEYGIRDYFSDVTLSSVTGFRKPSTDIFTVSLRQMRSRPEECVYVGDTVSRDVIGSKRAGFAAAVQIGSQLTREKDEKLEDALAPDVVIGDIYDVAGAVRALMKAEGD